MYKKVSSPIRCGHMSPIIKQQINHNHAAMRCKTTVRHARRCWWFVLVVDMRWRPRLTPFWWTVMLKLKFGAQWYASIKTGPPTFFRTNETGLFNKNVTESSYVLHKKSLRHLL